MEEFVAIGETELNLFLYPERRRYINHFVFGTDAPTAKKLGICSEGLQASNRSVDELSSLAEISGFCRIGRKGINLKKVGFLRQSYAAECRCQNCNQCDEFQPPDYHCARQRNYYSVAELRERKFAAQNGICKRTGRRNH